MFVKRDLFFWTFLGVRAFQDGGEEKKKVMFGNMKLTEQLGCNLSALGLALLSKLSPFRCAAELRRQRLKR